MTYQHLTQEQLGNIATEIDVAAYNSALDYLDDEGNQDVWLWNNGDFYGRLMTVCELIRDADGDSPNATPSMRDAAIAWLEQTAVG